MARSCGKSRWGGNRRCKYSVWVDYRFRCVGELANNEVNRGYMDKWQIYIQEALTQIQFAKSSWVAFLELEGRKGKVLDVFLHLQHFLTHAAIVDKILDPKKDSERYRVMSGHVDLSRIDLKPFRRLRNHLEHFDERLDKWVS